MNLPKNNYINILESLKERIRQARIKAAASVNTELLKLYWEIGNAILEQQKEEGWGTKIIDKLSIDLKTEFTDFKGLSVRNLKYMRAFAEAYPSFPLIVQPVVAQLEDSKNQETSIVQLAVAQIPWTHHILILDKLRVPEERLFYIEKTAQNGWSKAVLSLQIESKLHQRQGNAITNFTTTLPAPFSDLANETIKNPYVFDFLSYSEDLKERELEKGLIEHLKNFLLELGRGFAYVGNQKNINVAGDDFFLDLFFYNYHLHCFVVFELKVGNFEPEFAGKLNFYVNAVNEQIKGKDDKPTIGILLCKTPNETVVKYALNGIESPIGVAEYELAQALPEQLTGGILLVEELEAEINKEYEELKSPSQKRFDALKEKLSELKGAEIKQTMTKEILIEIVDKSLLSLFEALIKRISDFNELFYSHHYEWKGRNRVAGDSGRFTDITQFTTQWKAEDFLRNHSKHFFSYRFNAFKKGGTETFNCGFQLDYLIDDYWYGFTLVNHNNQEPILKKLYHQQLTQQEIEFIVETVYNFVLDEIERGIERLKK